MMRGHVPVGGGGGGPSLSSLSQLLVQQPAASIWGSSPAPMLGKKDKTLINEDILLRKRKCSTVIRRNLGFS